MKPHNESIFEQDIVKDLTTSGITDFSSPYLEGDPERYNAELALYPEDLISYLQATQPDMVQKVCAKQGNEEKGHKHIIREVAKAIDKKGALNSLRHGVEFVGAKFELAQFKPDNLANKKIKDNYDSNILTVVRQVKYSPYDKELKESTGHGSGIFDLVFFLNGVPVATAELKTDFTQSVQHAINQYKKDRSPFHTSIRKVEPLLKFNNRTLVHFAVSTEEVWMTTRLNGASTQFLPFNKGNGDGGGNPPNPDGYATEYLWKQVFEKETWLRIIGRFIHLEDKDKEGNKLKEADYKLIFPRYHQLDAVTKIISAAQAEGPGHNYLIQHSAGSGKSNSIAWIAHQLAAITKLKGKDQGAPIFRNVIVITDRNVLDSQLQDTIYQFEHQTGVVTRITREEGQGSKSAKLTEALTGKSPIIIVTIQTFPHILDAIQKETSLKDYNFAVIADEAHSSQTGKTAMKLKEVLQSEQADEHLVTGEDILVNQIAAQGKAKNISYFAFTATPKPKTLEIFGRLQYPEQEKSAENTPVPFHVYTMKQAIEEGFILDVLQNYVTYDVAYKIAHKSEDKEVDSKKAKSKVSNWVRLHPHNISQKVIIIVEHFKEHVMHMLDGQAKAMVVTGSRKEAVRYKLTVDKYVKDQKYQNIHSLVAFSGEVIDKENGEKPFTERNMNPKLAGRDHREAFDTSEYQLMIVANKFQTGFDQPKLCAMYVDKKLSGVDCVQTLSRLNRIYQGKETFILDFVNKADEVRESFEPFYKVTKLSDNSDPNMIFALKDSLIDARIFTWEHVENFVAEYLIQLAKLKVKKFTKATQKKLSSIVSVPANEFKSRYRIAEEKLIEAQAFMKQAKAENDKNMIDAAEGELNSAKEAKGELDAFKSTVNSYIDFYSFMSNIVHYDDENLEKLYIFLSHLKPLIKVTSTEDDLNLTGVNLSHYKIHNKKVHEIALSEKELDPNIPRPGSIPDKKKILFSELIQVFNELFGAEISDEDAIEQVEAYGKSLKPQIMKNEKVVNQLKAGNSPDQMMMGDFPKVLNDAILETHQTNSDLASRLLKDQRLLDAFARSMLNVFLDELKAG